MTIQGSGVVDGLGYDWWDREWKLENKHGRPKLMEIRRGSNLKFYGLEFRNSPDWFINIGGGRNVHFKDIVIDTNMIKQAPNVGHDRTTLKAEIFSFAGSLLEWYFGEEHATAFRSFLGPRPVLSWPTFPLNTDGLDLHG